MYPMLCVQRKSSQPCSGRGGGAREGGVKMRWLFYDHPSSQGGELAKPHSYQESSSKKAMEKPDQVCDLGRLQHLPIGKVQQEVGNDGCGGQEQEHHARVPGARLRAHCESSLKEREKTTRSCHSGHCRIRREGTGHRAPRTRCHANFHHWEAVWPGKPHRLSEPQFPL